MNYKKVAITITFSECVENHKGMEMIGEICEEGFSKKDLNKTMKKFSDKENDLVKLHRVKSVSEKLPNAYLLIIKDAVDNNKALLKELLDLEWDKKALMYKKVVNKHARYNLCFSDYAQDPDYEKGKGRVICFDQVPLLKQLKDKLEKLIPNSGKLNAEGNLYYDTNSCGIGYHGDSERKKVIGLRLGASFPLSFAWYKNNERKSERIIIDTLSSGDIYLMSEKTTGNDWKTRSIYTLRHSAGCDKYTK